MILFIFCLVLSKLTSETKPNMTFLFIKSIRKDMISHARHKVFLSLKAELVRLKLLLKAMPCQRRLQVKSCRNPSESESQNRQEEIGPFILN